MNQWHFEFNEWEEAFKFFYRKRRGENIVSDDGKVLGFREGNPNLIFVVCTEPITSGYWIEEGPSGPDERSTIYTTIEEVRNLERRVRRERHKRKTLSLGQVVK